jgi:DNA-binding transcriptional regulator YdaS (Cro superfamily)
MSENLTLFDRFGGTRKMAEMLGEAPSTVQSWKSAGRVPAAHQPKVLDRAREHGVDITAEDVIFPMGRESSPADISASATNGGEIIRTAEAEAASQRPFSLTSFRTTQPDAAADLAPHPSSNGDSFEADAA